jgi:vancomycin permeability regulator SanA/UDP-N-acetylmuramyl tripeptide synthase
MKIQNIIGLWAGKTAYYMAKLRGYNASAIPGGVANKVSPDFFKEITRDVEVYLVTGTNGKGNITGYIYCGDRLLDNRIVCNIHHSNMRNGMTTPFVRDTKWYGKHEKKIAVLECDELSLPVVLKDFKPRGILINNICMDQTDRNGGCDKLVEVLHEAVSKLPETTLYLNADDARVYAIAKGLPNRKIWYGSDCVLSDARELDECVCPDCGGKIVYSTRTLGHMGIWKCESCQASRPEPFVTVKSYEEGSTLKCTLAAPGKELEFLLPYAYPERLHNLAGAYALWQDIGGEWIDIAKGVLGFCRKHDGGNYTIYKDCNLYSELVKNPIGANMAISRFVNSKKDKIILLLGLNDYSVDSRDSSWINYVDFERLAKELNRISRIYIYGTAVDELHGRLKSAGFPEAVMMVVEDDEGWNRALSEKELFAFASGSAKSELIRRTIEDKKRAPLSPKRIVTGLRDLFMTVFTFLIYVLLAIPEMITGVFFYCIRRIKPDVREDEKWLVVMGCGYYIKDQINARLDKAAALWNRYNDLKIFLSGSESPGYSEPEYMTRYLVKKGVPLSAILRDGKGITSRATMKNAASSDIRKAAIVSSDYHLYRCVYEAKKAGIDAIAVRMRFVFYLGRWKYWLRDKAALYASFFCLK